MSGPFNPAAVRGSGVKELPAYLSNGVVGLRVRPNPLAAGMALLSGFSGLHPEKKIEAAAIAPYPLAANIALNGVWLSDEPHRVTVIDQAYDFSNGEVTSRIRFEAQGIAADITVLTFCSPPADPGGAGDLRAHGCRLRAQAAGGGGRQRHPRPDARPRFGNARRRS